MDCCIHLHEFRKTLDEISDKALQGSIEGDYFTMELDGRNRFNYSLIEENESEVRYSGSFSFRYCPFCGLPYKEVIT